MRKNTSIFTASCLKRDWQFARLEFVWHLLEFAFADSSVLFLIFFSFMNLLRALLKSLHTKTPMAIGQAGRKRGRTSSLQQLTGLGNSPVRLSSVIVELQKDYLGLLTTHHIPPLLPAPCHSCPGCAQGQRSHVMQNYPHTHRLFLFLRRFDEKRAVQQLRACGVLETIRISAAGFPSRCVCCFFRLLSAAVLLFKRIINCWD